MRKVASSYGQAAFWVAISVAIAAIAAHCLNDAKLSFLSDEVVRLTRVVTASLFATATLGRCGWNVQTWTGNTPAERLNIGLFRVLYIIGFALTVLSFLIKPV